MSGWYTQPVQYGREFAHKSRAAWAVSSLGVCMRERQHIYEDLNESSSASPGGSQQLEIPPSLNRKRAASIFQFRWFFSRGFQRPPRFYCPPVFCMAPTFSKSGCFFWKAPILFKSACFSEKRQYFLNLPVFLKSANIFQIRLLFVKAQRILSSVCFLHGANIL
jgi:hypothetical protein